MGPKVHMIMMHSSKRSKPSCNSLAVTLLVVLWGQSSGDIIDVLSDYETSEESGDNPDDSSTEYSSEDVVVSKEETLRFFDKEPMHMLERVST